MSVVSDEAQREALAGRISALVGIPVNNVQALMMLIPPEELEKLSALDDASFLKEGTRLINEATDKQAGAAAASSVETVNSKSEKRLILPKAPAADLQVPDTAGGSGLSVPSAAPAPRAAPVAQPAAPRATVSAAGPAADSSKKLQFRAPVATNDPVVEAPQLVVSADGNVKKSDDEIEIVDENTREINVAFMSGRGLAEGEDKPKMDRKSLVMLCVAGAIAAVVLLLMAVLGFMMILDSIKLASEPPPSTQDPIVINEDPALPVADDDDDDGTPVAVADPTEQRAISLSGKFEQEVPQPNLLEGTNSGFTVEYWFSSDKLQKVKNITLINSGRQMQFRLICGRDKKGVPIAFFDVPRASKRYVKVNLPDGRGWVHVAGVYDAAGDGQLRLFINGKLKAERKCTGAPRLLAVGYVLKAEVDEGVSLLIDELRFSAGAVYKKDFAVRKHRILKVSDITRSLLRFNKHENGSVPDAAQRGKAMAFAGDSFPKVDIEDFELALPAELECPFALLRALERKYGKKDADKFRREWSSFPDKEKRRLRKKFEQSGGNL